MTSKPTAKDMLRERLERLEADQIADLVLDLQSRIDGLRAELSAGHEPIAIVGQACRLPHADGVDSFKRLLFAGENAVGQPPSGRPEADNLAPAGYIADIDRFDAGFFGFRANEAAAMDPQQRMLMELTWHSLEDAGYADRHRRPASTGIFIGISTSDYEERFRGDDYRGFTPAAITGNARSIAAGRLAHWLDTTGPAVALDTACSSSLVAVHIACLSLRSGACDMAIAAGVNALLEGDLSDGFEAAGMLSVDHACKTFDAGANGYVRGEGGGVVVLKRLSDAERDGDQIRAVIRGGAINHDGRASALTAPNGSAQVAVVRTALENAGLAPGDVQVVECHGTGTALGDPIEVQALGEAYGPTRDSDLLIGAVKTNIGHLEAAAGIAGLIKLSIALEAGQLPATIHQASPNPRIAWNALPVRVIDEPMEWPTCDVRRGGVSSFGFSGTNAHIILEAAPDVDTASKADQPLTLLPLSAPDQDGISRLAASLASTMEANPDVGPDEIAASLAVGRETFSERAGVGGADRDALIDGLKEIAEGGGSAAGARGSAATEPPKVAFLFTGQGSQWSGMGRDLYDNDPTFKAIVDACAGVLEPHLPHPLVELMFDEAHEDLLLDTAIAQPTLFVLEYALAKRLEAWGIVPDIMIGHSLGELVAACLAGVIERDDALRLTAERGRLMGSLPVGGAMAAVFAPVATVEPLLADHQGRVDIAAINGPEDIVISGDADAVDAICDALETQDVGSQRLRVSHAFHSALMEPVLDTFQETVAGVSLSKPRLPVVSNVTATTDAPFTDPAYWARHIREPVRFADGVSAMIDHGVTVLVEIGATSALIGMAQRSLADNDTAITFVPTLRRNKPAFQGLGAALSRLFIAGAPIDWPALNGEARRATLPGYPFADERHWTPRPVRHAVATEQPAAATSPGQPTEAASAVSPSTSPEELREDVRVLLARSMQLEPAALDADVGLFELGVDSLALTEAIAAVERRWRITLARQAVFAEYNNARRLVAHVVDAIANRADAAEGDVTSQPIADRRTETPAPPHAQTAVQQPRLSETARAYLNGFARDYVERSTESRRQRETYEEVLADSRAVAGFRPETKAMLYPIVGAKGSGSHIVDVDGNDYVSLTMGFGVQLFGHNPAFVVEAMQRHLAEQGLFMGPQASLAGEVAERISRLTGNERVLFCNTGTEAVMTALRIARHTTGRTLVAMFAGSYHGHFDGTLARSGPDGRGATLAGGTPHGMVEDMLVLDYADPEGSLEALKQVAGDLAAVIVEPVQSRRPSLQPRHFLQQLRAFTDEIGAALVFDDVLLGFRVAQGGSQAWADVRADLVTYGKIVGGGLPIGVVAGRQEFLDAIDGGTWSFDGDDSPKESRTFFAGTFNKNPMTMAASKAVLTHLEESGPELQENLNARTAAFCERLNAVFAEEQTNVRVDQFASVFRFSGANDLFFNHLIANGVYVWEGRTCFLSTAHTDADLERVEEAVRRSVRAMVPARLMAARGPSEETPSVPTTPGQQALWVLAAFSPETSSAYNQSLVIDLDGEVDEPALTRALQKLCERHDSLRSSFSDDGASMTVNDAKTIDLEQVDIAGSDDTAGEAWIKAAAAETFDLETAPLLRAALLRLSSDHHRLVLIQPHIVTDGWSMQVLAVELGELYSAYQAGREPALSPAPAYSVYAEHARAMADAPEAAAHWLSLYNTIPPTLDLPADRPRPKLQTFDGGSVRHEIPATLSERLERRARDLGCSLFTLCLAGYGRLLSRLSGKDDLAVAIFAAGQPLVGERALTGYCVTTLPVRLQSAGTPSSRDLVSGTHQAMADALAYPAYPFPALIKALGMKRDPSRPPLTGVSFNLDRLDAEPVFDGLKTALDANAHGSVRWDLNWNMMASADGLQIDANFNTNLFDQDRVEGWVATYVDILEALCNETGEAPLSASPGTEPEFETLAHRVTAWATATPDAVAVLDHAGATDYAALDSLAANLAGQLAAEGIARGDRVAFKLDRGLGPVVAMLAAARIGAAFVPLDPDHPDEHHAYILRDSGARMLIAETAGDDGETGLPVMAWRGNDHDIPSGVPGPCGVAPEDLAYVLYTSGSTGRPKGVMVPWRAVETYSAALLARLGVDMPTSFAVVTSFAADLGYTSVFGALRSGGTLHAIDAETARDPNRLIAWFQDHPVDMVKIVPTHMAALMTAPDAVALVPGSALIFGGDVLTYDLVDRVRALSGDCRIFNHYGPTETTIGATMIEVTGDLRRPDETAVPIGRPLDGYTIEVIDDDGGLVGDNVTGELRIAGAAVAAGYVTPHGEERARFSRGADGVARYATGDLGRRRGDGVIEFAGRKDDVVKIRGHQVDPAGITTLLRTHPQVRDAAIVVDRRENRAPRLVGAVVADEAPEAVTAWLSERVPAAMCPSRLIALDAIPLNANGKIDRTGLLAMMDEPAQEQPVPSGQNDGRTVTMCEIWREVLEIDLVGPNDDFFALGGDSIVAIRIAGKARAAGLTISPSQIFEHATPASLAAAAVSVDEAASAKREPADGAVPLTPIQRWFMAIGMAKRDQWALTAVFDVAPETTTAQIDEILSVLIKRHDALRTALRHTDGTDSQELVAEPAEPAVIVHKMAGDDDVALATTEDDLADQLIAGLDLERGHVIAGGLVTSPSGAAKRLIVAAHHFAFDMVSWGIVAEDIGAALTEGTESIAPVPTPWTWWCNQLAAYAEAARPQLDHWRSVEATGSTAIPIDRPDGADSEGDAQEVERPIDAGVSQTLLTSAAETYAMQAHEVVLAALGRVFVRWSGAATIVDLEGHGREPLDATIDLSRTVGWFTTRYPLALPHDQAGDPRHWLVAVKEALRGLPQRGMGYGLLRYVDGADLTCRPTVSYNFVGEISRYGGELGLVRLGAGHERDPAAERPHDLVFTAWLDNGAICLRCQHAGKHTTATVTALLDDIADETALLAEHCATASGRVYTPGDFTDLDFSQDELDQLTAEVLGSD